MEDNAGEAIEGKHIQIHDLRRDVHPFKYLKVIPHHLLLNKEREDLGSLFIDVYDVV